MVGDGRKLTAGGDTAKVGEALRARRRGRRTEAPEGGRAPRTVGGVVVSLLTLVACSGGGRAPAARSSSTRAAGTSASVTATPARAATPPLACAHTDHTTVSARDGASDVFPALTGALLTQCFFSGTLFTGGIAAGPEGAWFGTTVGDGGCVLVHLDPRTVQPSGEVALGQSCPVALAYTQGALWVLTAGTPSARLVQVDAGTTKITADVAVPGLSLSAEAPAQLAMGFGSAWVVKLYAPEPLVRIDPASGNIQAQVALPAPASGLAVAEDGVWVASMGDRSFASTRRPTVLR